VSRTVLFVAGGSIGHTGPAVAVWQELKKLHPDWEEYFICTNRGEECVFLETNHCAYSVIDAPRLKFSFLWKFPVSYFKCRSLLTQIKPDLIFSKGSYVSVPICLAAKHKKIPIVVHESDTVSGRANKLVSRWAEAICYGFPVKDVRDEERKLKLKNMLRRNKITTQKNHFTGNPIRAEVTRGSEEEGRRITGFNGGKSVLLVMGGSQGAQALNDAIAMSIHSLTQLCDVIHITGKGKEVIREKIPGYWQCQFAKTELPHLYAIADLALSRCGAGAINELGTNGIPAILVPLRGVGHDHQQKNARLIEKHRGCVLLDQDRLKDRLIPTVIDLLDDPGKCSKLSEGLKSLTKSDAALQIAKIISGILADSRSSH